MQSYSTNHRIKVIHSKLNGKKILIFYDTVLHLVSWWNNMAQIRIRLDKI